MTDSGIGKMPVKYKKILHKVTCDCGTRNWSESEEGEFKCTNCGRELERYKRNLHNPKRCIMALYWRIVEFFEDWSDLRAAKKALKRNDFINWEDLKKQLDID